MRQPYAIQAAIVLAMTIASASYAQPVQSSPTLSVPRVISVGGVYQPADGEAAPAGTVVTLSIYADEQGGAPLWQETQNVALDKGGRFTLLLGVTQPDGIPLEIFASGEARWLGMHFAGLGEAERPRTRLTSVPYALRSSDADTLGGRPASAYALAPTAGGSTARGSGMGSTAAASNDATAQAASAAANVVLAGTPNYLAKYFNSADVGQSALYESGGFVGLGTTTPFDALHLRFTNTNGGMTGYAVQNLGSTATSYSGMLFYDQNGALGQFQGFNNSTHEYRINNIAQNGSSQFNGSINFMIGNTSRFFIGSSGNVGIGTSSPQANLEVSNANSAAGIAGVNFTSFAGSTPSGSLLIGRKARGTSASPSAVQNGDILVGYQSSGFGATQFSPTPKGGMTVVSTENWTDTAQGTKLIFTTTGTGTTTNVVKMAIDSAGNVGIGTSNPGDALELFRSGTQANIVSTTFDSGGEGGAVFMQYARGTPAAPSAVQAGDLLGLVGANGYGATHFGEGNAAMGMAAAENWTDTAHGTAIGFLTTPLGTDALTLQMAVLSNGNLAVGTPLDSNGIPTATDKVQVFGDIRVGTVGTNGCIKNFAGTGIIGTCSSDRRLKKNITPFGPALDKLTALQPVHFDWRASEFPERHFGDSRAYGLIAQEVEQVLPELVVTDQDGYKAIDYTKLPLLTIQAIKELKERVAELEQLLDQMRATSPRR